MITVAQIPDMIELLDLPPEYRLALHIDFYNSLIESHPFIFMGKKQIDKNKILSEYANSRA